MKSTPPGSASEERRYFKEVRFRQIRALVETARHTSFAEASRHLGMSTPSVWRQVRALEEEYGVSLLKAHGHTVRLTEDGERLMELAAPLVEGFESLKRLFADSQARAGRVLRLTAPPTIFTGFLDKPLNVYRKLHPEVRLSMIECSSREAWELVVADKADLAVVGAPEGLELPPALEVTPLAIYPFQAVCPKNYPFAKIKQPTLQDFINQPLILAGEKSSSRIQLNLFVSKAGLQNQLNVVMLATSVQLMLNCVALGIGVAMVTRLATDSISIPAEQATSLVYRDISSLLGSENIALVSRRGRFELPHIQAFREVVLSMRTELHPKPPATKKPRRS